MKAIRYHRYRAPDVLQLDEVPAPIPRSGQVLVRVAATSVNPKDALLRTGRLRLLGPGKPPQIPGNDFAGTVEAVGRGVRSRRADPEQLARWLARKDVRAVVDRVLPLAKAAEAHRYVETKRARGKVVLSVQ